MASKAQDTLLVAAIDFGTTYSGYAFSLRDKPLDIQTPQTWYSGSAKLISLKTSTCLLIQPREKFKFGFEAENTYAELTEKGEHEDCYFFQHFKMLLHENKNLTKSTILEDISGKTMKALDIFALSIEYFKDHLMDTLHSRLPGVELADVHFVITVPAIWNDSAKQFMREAATKAGLDNSRVSLALEPEAASVFCQQIPSEKFASSSRFEALKAGMEYMVVDLGGGTADITVHRKEVDGSLKSLHAASGGPWGGQMVNKEYLKTITDIVGRAVMETFKKEEMGDYFELLRDFETKKRTITPDKEGNIVIRIPVSLKELYEDHSGCNFADAIQNSRHNKHISFNRDKLKVQSIFMKQLFNSSITSIVNHVSDILAQPEMQNVGRLLLVGGYSECTIVHQALYDRFGKERVIIPHEAGLAVIKGALHFGHNPSIISSRVLSYTYGSRSRKRFKEGKHLESKKVIDSEGVARCKDLFTVYKRAGDTVKIGEVVSEKCHPLTEKQKTITFHVYATPDPNPKYVTDSGCKWLGKVALELEPFRGEKRGVCGEFVFGGTEFMLEVTDLQSKKKLRKYFDLPE